MKHNFVAMLTLSQHGLTLPQPSVFPPIFSSLSSHFCIYISVASVVNWISKMEMS